MSSSDPTTLKQRVLHASGWSIVGYGISQAIRLGTNLLMARLLVPEMFGVMAIATMVTVVLGLLSDVGLRQNIVQSRRGDDPVFLDTAWVAQIVRGLVLWVVALLLAAALHLAGLGGMLPAGSAYASAVLPAVIALSSFSAVISGFQSTKMATADRRLDQRRITQIALISQISALLVMIVIALMSRTIWALVVGGLVGSLIPTALSHCWMSGQSNRFRCEKSALQELRSFGKWIFFSSVVGAFVANGDRLMLGGFVSEQVLGLYAIAVLFVEAIQAGISSLFMTVSLPALSEIARNEPSRMREAYYKFRVPGDLLMLFMAGLLFAAGQLLINILYDTRYSAAGGMLEILALSLCFGRYAVAYQMYIAIGKPRYLVVVNIVRFVSLYVLVPPLYYLLGMRAAIWGIALHSLATVPLVFAFNAGLGLNDFRRELKVLPAFLVGFVCGSALNLILG
jgi:O-antigen/teichoic acid export membrane protein